MSDHSPKRPRGFYEAALRQWRVAGILHGLTDMETVLLSAQFCGLAVAAVEGSAETSEACLETAARAMRTAHAGRVMVKQGYGRAVVNDSTP